MLRYAGSTPHHFTGMLFGGANRWQCSLDQPLGSASQCPFDPRAVWGLWKVFGIEQAVQFGWWLERERGAGAVPVKATVVVAGGAGGGGGGGGGGGDVTGGGGGGDTESVRVTAYVRKGHSTLLAIASFAKTPLTVTLSIDWAALGLDPSAPVFMHAPLLVPMQPKAQTFKPTDQLLVPVNQGWLLVLSNNSSNLDV
jgi:hypothetical protein